MFRYRVCFKSRGPQSSSYRNSSTSRMNTAADSTHHVIDITKQRGLRRITGWQDVALALLLNNERTSRVAWCCRSPSPQGIFHFVNANRARLTYPRPQPVDVFHSGAALHRR